MSFAELVATTITNEESRAEVRRLADRHAALREVATLVAGQPSPQEVFSAVVEQVGRVLGFDVTRLLRYRGRRDGAAPDLLAGGRRGARQRHPARRRQRRRTRARDRATRPDRRLHGRAGSAGGGDPQPWRALGGRRPDRRRRTAVGRPRRHQQSPRAAARGYRVARRGVHRARGHRDRQRRGARRGAPARRPPGGAAARGDARRAASPRPRRSSRPSSRRSAARWTST